MSGPFAEDLALGVTLPAAPEITIDDGLAAQYLAISGDQLRASLSEPFARSLTGQSKRLANPNLVIGLSIGQSTVATRNVIANLSYRNLVLQRQVFTGESITTFVTPWAASWTSRGTDRAKVLLNMDITTSDGDVVAAYQRLALLPVRDPSRFVALAAPIVTHAELEAFDQWTPDWSAPTSGGEDELAIGMILDDPLADTVSSARELVRLTQNQASTHRDARVHPTGKRLVYGGHTVALAQASVSRMLRGLLTVIAWRTCNHLAPVFEDDLLSFRLRIDDLRPSRGMLLADATVWATAQRSSGETAVLEWRPVLLLENGDPP